MGWTTTVTTGRWEDIAASGIWVYVHPDPLTDTGSVRVSVHPDPFTVHVEGANAGVYIQTTPPHTTDGGQP